MYRDIAENMVGLNENLWQNSVWEHILCKKENVHKEKDLHSKKLSPILSKIL
jgi:hypothetical protein